MYPTANLQNSFTYPFYPSPNFVIDQATLSRVAALFSATPAVDSGRAYNSSSSSTNTIIASCESENTVPYTPSSAPGPIRYKRHRLEFCKVCQKSITEEGKRSQGPRRHILMNHLCRPLFFCPHPNCKATSNYDKAHITSHIRRIHNNIGEVIVVEKQKYAEEEDRWFKLCFGTGSEKPSNDFAPTGVDEDIVENIVETSAFAVYPATVYQDSGDDSAEEIVETLSTHDIYEEDEDVDIEGPFTFVKAVKVEGEEDVTEKIIEAPSKPLSPIPFSIDWILSK